MVASPASRIWRLLLCGLASDGAGARESCLFAHRGKPGWHSGAVLEAPALVAGFDDFTMMGQTIKERGGHLRVAKHTGPIAKGQIGGDDNGSGYCQDNDLGRGRGCAVGWWDG